MGVVISDKDTINVYKFMEMCGLKCKIKKNVKVSHSIMLRKLELRHKLFPSEVCVPSQINIYSINNEDVKRGNIILVKDDYDKRIAYDNPKKLENIELDKLTERERKQIRKKLLKEYKKELENSDETLKAGYIKYLVRKQTKEQNEEENIDIEPEEEYVIENRNRIKKLNRRRYGRE